MNFRARQLLRQIGGRLLAANNRIRNGDAMVAVMLARISYAEADAALTLLPSIPRSPARKAFARALHGATVVLRRAYNAI